jgi:hypothetical protein
VHVRDVKDEGHNASVSKRFLRFRTGTHLKLK